MLEDYILNHDELEVPFSDRRYTCTIDGVVKEKGVVLPTFQNNGVLVVKLDWVSGLKEYPVANVLLHTYKPTKYLPLKHWKRLSVDFLDGSGCLHPSKLNWRFPPELEADFPVGFYFIPGHTRYVMNRDGIVWDRLLKTHVVANSRYRGTYLRLVRDVQNRSRTKYTTITMHRLKGFVFLTYPTNYRYMHINHIDGDYLNHALENLEWCTPKENSVHAKENRLLGGKYEFILPDGSMTHVRTDAARAIGLNPIEFSKSLSVDGVIKSEFGEVRYKKIKYKNTPKLRFRLTDHYNNRTKDYESLKHFSRDYPGYGAAYRRSLGRMLPHQVNMQGFQVSEWGVHAPQPTEVVRINQQVRPIEVRNCETGEIKCFESAVRAAEYVGISIDGINWACRHSPEQVRHEKYQIRDADPIKPFRIPEDYRKEWDLQFEDAIDVYDIKTGAVSSYMTHSDFCRAVSMGAPTITAAFHKSDQPVVGGRYLLKKRLNPTPFRELTFHEKNSRSNQRIVYVRNVESGEITRYSNAYAAALSVGIGPTLMNWWLKKPPEFVHRDKYQVRYHEVESSW